MARGGADWQPTIVLRDSFSPAPNVYPKRPYARHSQALVGAHHNINEAASLGDSTL